MEKEEGVVIEVAGDIARIKVGKHNECKNCGACPGNDSAIITAKNQIGAAPGQRVVFEMSQSNSLKAAFIVFVLPLIGVFIGALLGGQVADLTGYSTVPCRIVGGIVVFILVALFIKRFDNYVGKKEKSLPVIVKIL